MADKQKSQLVSLDAGINVVPAGDGQIAGPDAVGVDKIRDLLFGNQMQDYDRRFSKLEERFLQRFKDTESETARNLSAYDSNSKKQVESLASQLREEKDLRADGDKEIKRRNEDVHHTLEKMFAELSNVKTDRNLLAGLFVEVAKCLNQDTGAKGAGKGAGDSSRSWSAA